ncbi:MAG: hypothetical protein ABJA98_02330 [Acidobacteriota bacterium]
MRRALLCLATLGAIATKAAYGQSAGALPKGLPDWSGAWVMQGPTVFDPATVQPPNGRAGDPGVREFPPYNDEWEALYKRHIDLIRQGTFPDPISTCGTPHGFPRMMNVPDVYEFAVTPEKVVILAENGPNILRIYTDGRTHPAKEDLWPTYNGSSVGHWEGDTLVFDTISMKGWSGKDVILDRTGLVLSDASRVTTRLRRLDETTMEAQMIVTDPKALKAPWPVTKRYRRQPAGTWGWDYACAENNRNPISDSGRTLTLGPDGKPIDKVVK